MKLLRAIRLDPSDGFVFERAAEPGEVVVAGSFAFWDVDLGALEGKARAAFRSGFLAVGGGGFTTLAQVCEADGAEIDQAVERLAALLVRDHGAPDLAAAQPAAREEIAASIALAEHAPDTLIAMRRTCDVDGEIREQFRTLQRRAAGDRPLDPRHDRAFSFFAVEDAAEPEAVDFAALIKEKRP